MECGENSAKLPPIILSFRQFSPLPGKLKTKMCITSAPYLHHKSVKWAFNMVLFYAFVLMFITKLVPNSSAECAVLASFLKLLR